VKNFQVKDHYGFVFRGGAQGIDDSIFPRRMEIDWIYYYQWQ
jgi:hypothetical protein